MKETKKRVSIRAPLKLPKRGFRNRYFLRNKCQKHVGPDNFIIMQELINSDQKKIDDDGPTIWHINMQSKTDLTPLRQMDAEQEHAEGEQENEDGGAQ